ncbi:hypothetical protein [Hyalangium minutum]|uniref:Uncharacterized protein n=1 Tax=Hyalangium minutum TaxID=394096 RepID=A0A085WUQ2_9BACT|nr:hypothetical protein [Hyalangium minutum]KFE71415.1 hypothetical protein DB31_3545 [Hyalangium minutum]
MTNESYLDAALALVAKARRSIEASLLIDDRKVAAEFTRTRS